MTKITFRADDALVERLDSLDTSKSEAMREALREYLDQVERDDTPSLAQAAAESQRDDETELDAVLAKRVERLVEAQLDERLPTLVDEALAARADTHQSPSEVNVNINVDGDGANSGVNAEYDRDSTPNRDRKTPETIEDTEAHETASTCGQCGESVESSHVYCPNCGEKASHRVFCECGDELRSDWAFCPDCGRRTPAADVLE
ncbi:MULTISPECIES: zinc ribbon domain-containing protein [Haloferax]|uniref:Ribbon-helix-helix protein, CopG family n=2 Tax=Haloferax TaxID=2251 RepID=A0A6G1YXZ7_9EURY|nr:MULTISPECIES: zinc ribbon domain-containing protein [Haloferax]KAB1186648.1 ribbon-helix-helix protein, CopG family [Haloferax sp. CBA1149]MRW79267.1 ribbon-helix-helix protein, CopG family [Haloferax marinisediminis]